MEGLYLKHRDHVMAVDLHPLLAKFRNVDDFESKTAIFKTRVPWVAPLAYLNILFKPCPEQLLIKRSEELSIPTSLADFYRSYNGMNLFADFVRIWGLRPDFYQLDRMNWREPAPYDIQDLDKGTVKRLKQMNLLCFADYGYDGSYICIDRADETIRCFKGRSLATTRRIWKSFDEWITGEISRIAFYFDETGRNLVPREELLPDAGSATIA